jgi:hypothetical protein
LKGTQHLRPGDRFVDVGANIGMLSLLGARLVVGLRQHLILAPASPSKHSNNVVWVPADGPARDRFSPLVR